MGSPSTVIRQLGQLPAAQSNPRGRWYLKLRLKTTVPDAERAEATVSPSNPRTLRPSNSNSTVDARSMASPGTGCESGPVGVSHQRVGTVDRRARMSRARRWWLCPAGRRTSAGTRSDGSTIPAALRPYLAGSKSSCTTGPPWRPALAGWSPRHQTGIPERCGHRSLGILGGRT